MACQVRPVQLAVGVAGTGQPLGIYLRGVSGRVDRGEAADGFNGRKVPAALDGLQFTDWAVASFGGLLTGQPDRLAPGSELLAQADLDTPELRAVVAPEQSFQWFECRVVPADILLELRTEFEELIMLIVDLTSFTPPYRTVSMPPVCDEPGGSVKEAMARVAQSPDGRGRSGSFGAGSEAQPHEPPHPT